MAKPSRSHDDLQQLLEERKRYEQWMTTLESRRDSTPEHVYTRVHGDYQQRLTTVRGQLAERAGEIRTAISGFKDRLKQAMEQEAARVDELHEAELRAAVGEFTSEQWELRKREVEVDLERFVHEKKTISEELNQLLMVMEQAAGPDTSAEQMGASTPPEPPPAVIPATPTSEEPATQVPVPPPLPAPAQADATRVRSKTPSRSRAALPSKPSALADEKATEGKPTAAAPAPADTRRENEKTLKCGECGTVNYPTEWYCESCGAELSAL